MKYRLVTAAVALLVVCSFSAAFGSTPKVVEPTSYRQMAAELKLDQKISPLIHVSIIGYSAKDKRPILIVRLGEPAPGRTVILATCRQHGDEPSGTEGALTVINQAARNPESAQSFR